MPQDLTYTYRDLADYLKAQDSQIGLILGPDLSVDQQGTSFRSYFRTLAEDNTNDIFCYFEKDNLFSFTNESAIKDTRRLVREFYRNAGDRVLLETIARLKFPLIINLSPDISLNKVYNEQRIAYKSGYFSKDSKPRFKDLPYPTRDLPVIYNIFGTVESDTSLILNHGKLYETIQYLLPDNSLPENIETFLNQATGFLLLGLKFDSWYYQLICHKLRLKEYQKNKTNLSASGGNETDMVSVVMRDNFEIDFTPENPMQAIDRLLIECQGDPAALRKPRVLTAYSLYVSYAWKDEQAPPGPNRETIVDWAEKYSGLQDLPSLLFFRDHKELKFGDSIDSFMTRIGMGKTVIRVISDKYLRSRYCMLEALRMDKYRDQEKRIYTIVWRDAALDDKGRYLAYWKTRCGEILDNIDRDRSDDEFGDAGNIYGFIGKFIDQLKDEISLRVGPDDLLIDEATGAISVVGTRKEEFKTFIDTITDKLRSPGHE